MSALRYKNLLLFKRSVGELGLGRNIVLVSVTQLGDSRRLTSFEEGCGFEW
jgi:hypothetical protein